MKWTTASVLAISPTGIAFRTSANLPISEAMPTPQHLGQQEVEPVDAGKGRQQVTLRLMRAGARHFAAASSVTSASRIGTYSG